jgi:alpha-methylacyl-CoA racemase
MSGALDGIRIVEFAGLGPAPFAAMMLADMGAEVIRVERPDQPQMWVDRMMRDPLNRSRRSITLDLKLPTALEVTRRLIGESHGLIEGFRPGVMERLGLGPDLCLELAPGLVYGRMTGWGQTGSLAASAGHDINYISLSGALAAIGSAGGPPVPPINLVGDFGGGGMLLAFGMACALLSAARGGAGQVVDAAMVDGSALLMAMTYGLYAMDDWTLERGTNRLDGGAHFYATYRCADGLDLAVGAIEPQFYARLLEVLGIDASTVPPQLDRSSWPAMHEQFAALFRTRTRPDWLDRFATVDACVSPVLDLTQVAAHPHNRERETFLDVGGVLQPAPAPRLSRTSASRPAPPRRPGADNDAVLLDLGLSEDEIIDLRQQGVFG